MLTGLWALLASWSAAAAPVSVAIPSQAARVVFAPRAEAFAADAAKLLGATNALRGPSRESLGLDLERRLGLPLLDAEGLAARGVDVSRDWIWFERQGSTFLGLWVRDRARLTQAMDAWAQSRLLRGRDRKAVGKGEVVTYSRAKGTRPACGYFVLGDRAVVLVNPSDRTVSLEAAMSALDGAVPVRTSVSGSLLVWASAAPYAKEAWLGLTLSEQGVSISGTVRDVQAGWLAVDPARTGWVAALTGAATPEQLLRIRLLTGPKAANAAARLFTQAAGPDDMKAVDAVAAAAKGPVEVAVPKFVLPRTGARLSVEHVPELLSPTLILLGKEGDEATVRAAKARGATYTVMRQQDALLVGLGEAPPSIPPEPAGTPRSCPSGQPVASARLDAASLARSLQGIGLLASLGDDVMLGLYGLRTEFGPFLERLPSASILVCQDGGRWLVDGGVRLPRR